MKMKRERVGDWSDRSSITCYACGEKGHISTHCPKTQKRTTKKTKVMSETDDESMSMMRASTNHMSNEQVIMFARELMAARSASTNVAEGQAKT
ncbi:MAG: hypothetical protein ACO20I_14255 [bacterium]